MFFYIAIEMDSHYTFLFREKKINEAKRAE